jgi:hypothetical protein
MTARNNHHERGNVFVFILLGIVLFASLSFFIAKGMRSQTTEGLKGRKAELAAADILSYAQSLERGINRLRMKNVSENDISFESAQDMAYAHTPAVDNAQKLFHPAGGAISWQAPAQDVNDGSDWVFTGGTCIPDLGTGAAGCGSDGNIRNQDLLAVLPNVVEGVCEALNDRLNITGIPADSGGGASITKFTGDFAEDTELILLGGPFTSACFSRGGGFYFYSVLLAR